MTEDNIEYKIMIAVQGANIKEIKFHTAVKFVYPEHKILRTEVRMKKFDHS